LQPLAPLLLCIACGGRCVCACIAWAGACMHARAAPTDFSCCMSNLFMYCYSAAAVPAATAATAAGATTAARSTVLCPPLLPPPPAADLLSTTGSLRVNSPVLCCCDAALTCCPRPLPQTRCPRWAACERSSCSRRSRWASTRTTISTTRCSSWARPPTLRGACSVSPEGEGCWRVCALLERRQWGKAVASCQGMHRAGVADLSTAMAGARREWGGERASGVVK